MEASSSCFGLVIVIGWRSGGLCQNLNYTILVSGLAGVQAHGSGKHSVMGAIGQSYLGHQMHFDKLKLLIISCMMMGSLWSRQIETCR